MWGKLTTPEQLDARLTYLRGLIHARSDVIVCSVPVAVLVLAGCTPGAVHPAVVLACLVGELVTVLVCDPWGCLDRCLAPLSRSLLVLAVLLVGLAVVLLIMADPAPGVAAVLLVLAALCLAVVIYRRKAWLLAWQVQQSPEVDRVLAHLNGKGNKGAFAPAAAWERDGCRETRSMLHQALKIECNEAELETLYKAVYLLAYLHGKKGQGKELDALQAQLKAAQKDAKDWREIAQSKDDRAAEYAELCREYDKLQAQYNALSDSAHRYYAAQKDAEQRATDAEAEADKWRPEAAEDSTEAAVIAYLNAGHSERETAKAFGITRYAVAKIAKDGLPDAHLEAI
ncbi:MAG: hypothetical protein LUG44_03705 [Clostridiales bacterium]|nr:hypothetical protein [Clostridiales bacterium]